MAARVSVLAIVAAVLAVSACDPFGLPATRALENGAAEMLSSSQSYEMSGGYSASTGNWSIDMQLERPDRRHIFVNPQSPTKVEAIIVGRDAYFRGKEFLKQRLGANPLAPAMAAAAGSAWWKDSVSLVPSMPDFTNGAAFRSTFLGSAVSQRSDHQQVAGVDAVELSGARADVYIASASPFNLLRVHLKPSVQVDALGGADFTYSNVGKDFRIAAPQDVIDFANLSTLPPIYTVVSVDTSGCGSPCAVSARLKNLGGLTRAKGPSVVTFTLLAPGSDTPIGTCRATVQPDVGYNSTTTVSCTIASQAVSGGVVTAAVDNPGHV